MKLLKNNLYPLFSLLLLAQLIIFRDYLSPVQWGQVKVSGLACTCPDETVVNGEWYLQAITPDSLAAFDLDYSEIFVSEAPHTEFDQMGRDEYIIEGEVIGKKRVYEGDPWNPYVEVHSWRPLGFIKNSVIKFFFSLQLIIFLVLLFREWDRRNRKKLKVKMPIDLE